MITFPRPLRAIFSNAEWPGVSPGVSPSTDAATAPTSTHPPSWTDDEIVARVLAGEVEAFELIMRRYNARLFRVAVAILRNPSEAEDVVQDAYVRAFQHLRQFAGRAMFSTWLTRIAVNEALARAKRQARHEPLELESDFDTLPAARSTSNPERAAAEAEMKLLLEHAILSLPDIYREVLVMRDVQEISTAETAECLGITEENVKIRLHRARAMLRQKLFHLAGPQIHSAFGFDGERCDRIVARTMDRIAQLGRM